MNSLICIRIRFSGLGSLRWPRDIAPDCLTTPRKLAEQALLMEGYSATCLCHVDSGDVYSMNDVRGRFRAFKSVLKPETET